MTLWQLFAFDRGSLSNEALFTMHYEGSFVLGLLG